MPKAYRVCVQLSNMAHEFQKDMNELRVTLWTDTTQQYTQMEYIPVDDMTAMFDQVVAVAIDRIKRAVVRDSRPVDNE